MLQRCYVPEDELIKNQAKGQKRADATGKVDVPLERIFHIGVVYGVRRDAVGQVESYRLFHGRRPGKVASITNWHRRTSEPPFGNGNEELVAIAWPSPELVPAGMQAVAAVADDWVERARQ